VYRSAVQYLLLVRQVLLAPELPVALDEVTEYNCTCIRLGFCPPSNISCVSYDTDCEILKTYNYGNEMEELKLEYKKKLNSMV
jgi:hypothetical protein